MGKNHRLSVSRAVSWNLRVETATSVLFLLVSSGVKVQVFSPIPIILNSGLDYCIRL